MKSMWFKNHLKKPFSGNARGKVSGATTLFVTASAAILMSAFIVTGCGKKSPEVQKQAEVPPPPPAPAPAPVPPPPPPPAPQTQVIVPAANEDYSTPLSNVFYIKDRLTPIGMIERELSYDDGDYEPLKQAIYFNISTHSPKENVADAFISVYSNGILGEIKFSRYLDLNPSLSQSIHFGNIQQDVLVFRSHPVQIPTLESLKPGFTLDSPILPFAFELKLVLRNGVQVDPAQSRIRILGCGSSRCSAEKVPPGIKLKLNKGRR